MFANTQEHYCNATADSVAANWQCVTEQSDADLIRALMDHTRLTPSQIARRANLAATTLTRPLNQPVSHRLSLPTLDKLKATFPGFFAGEIEPDLPEQRDDRDYARVEIIPSYAGMGGGGTGDDDPGTALLPRRLLEQELRGKPTDFQLIDVRGESMTPDFLHGDQILIDKRDRDPRQPGSFALWDGEGYVVKLVERVPHKRGWYRIFSANERYTPYEVNAEDVIIMGRPVWFGRRL